MSPDLVSLLAQIPLVGIFVAYVIITRRQDSKDQVTREAAWQGFIKNQSDLFLAALKDHKDAIALLTNTLLSHDAKTDQAIAVMRDRTQPRREKEEK